jgi:hypothetical protein
MKVIDQISSQLESLTNDLRSAPTQIGALEAAAAAGVTIPNVGSPWYVSQTCSS